MSEDLCTAAVNVQGEHYPCVQEAGHLFAHRNPDAQAIWSSPDELTRDERVVKEMSTLGL